MPTMSPPTTAPITESSPPRMTTGNTLRPTSASWLSTPSMAPHTMPASAETIPAIAHATAQEEPSEDGKKDQTDAGTNELDRLQYDWAEEERLVVDWHDDGAGAG